MTETALYGLGLLVGFAMGCYLIYKMVSWVWRKIKKKLKGANGDT